MTAVLPEHKCRHTAYRLTCAQFEALMEQAEGKCEMCHQPHPRLHIDHDHSKEWPGVRGLLCPKCNARMRRIDSGEQEPDEDVARYLAASWYLTHQTDSQPSLASIQIYVDPETKAEFAAALTRFIRDYNRRDARGQSKEKK